MRRSGDESLFDSLVETYHYLGYTHPVGEHLKYLISAGGVPVACMGWSSAPRYVVPRRGFREPVAIVARGRRYTRAHSYVLHTAPWRTTYK